MSTNIKNNLSRLMTLFSVTGRELAKALHVDYSLVSMWKNSKRSIQPRSEYSIMLAEYFMSLDKPSNMKRIKIILKEAYPDRIVDEHNIDSLLNTWLTEKKETNFSDSCIVIEDPIKKYYRAYFDVYLENEGRRNAVIDFLDLALSLPRNQELMLISQEDMTWLTEDQEFLQLWKMKLAENIHHGNKITMIHSIDRNAGDMAPILHQWLPLHLSGSVTSWYIPQYMDSYTKSTLFIIKDTAVLAGISSQTVSNSLCTAFYKDYGSAAHYQGVFSSLLSKCTKLLDIYSLDHPERFFEKFENRNLKNINSFYITRIPPYITMDEALLLEILNDNSLSATSIQLCLNIFKNSQYSRFNPAAGLTKHIYCLDSISNLLEEDKIFHPDLSILANSEIYISRSQFIRQIRNIIKLLESSFNFEVGFVFGASFDSYRAINTLVKESNIVISFPSDRNPFLKFAASAVEPTVVNAFYQYYLQLWNSIPRIYKNKELVIERLKSLI